jgi:hypothetical protein
MGCEIKKGEQWMNNREPFGTNFLKIILCAFFCLIVFESTYARILDEKYIEAILVFFAFPILFYIHVSMMSYMARKYGKDKIDIWFVGETKVPNLIKLMIAFYPALFITKAKSWMYL